MRQDLQSWAGFNYQDWQTAAQFCADNKVNLEEALTWADKAIDGPFRGATIGHEDFSTLSTKAAVLDAMGREAEADAVMQKALHLPGTDSYSIFAYGMGLLRKDKKADAMKVFAFNQQQHPQEKFSDFPGAGSRLYGNGRQEESHRQLGGCCAECSRQPEQQNSLV